MAESTALIKALNDLRQSISTPMSHMELVRQVVMKQAAAQHRPDLRTLLTPEQKQLMSENLERIESFLATEDGSDAWELVVASFREFVTSKPTEAEPVEPAPAPTEEGY
jgi:hypothetical protein